MADHRAAETHGAEPAPPTSPKPQAELAPSHARELGAKDERDGDGEPRAAPIFRTLRSQVEDETDEEELSLRRKSIGRPNSPVRSRSGSRSGSMSPRLQEVCKNVPSPLKLGGVATAAGLAVRSEGSGARPPKAKLRTTTKRLFERPNFVAVQRSAVKQFQRVVIEGTEPHHSNSETKEVADKLQRAMGLRDKYLEKMPRHDWGGLDKAMYRDFMADHGADMEEAGATKQHALNSKAPLTPPATPEMSPAVQRPPALALKSASAVEPHASVRSDARAPSVQRHHTITKKYKKD